MALLPKVRRALDGWARAAAAIPDPTLREIALSAQRGKAFHCQGGAVLALLVPREQRTLAVELVVALQTASDYLDSLVDRGPSVSIAVMRRLHFAMTDAFSDDPQGAYYAGHPLTETGYLDGLVEAVRAAADAIGSGPQARRSARTLMRRYSHLQSLKHAAPDHLRERLLSRWHRPHRDAHDLDWWEYGAACGSTLGTFALLLSPEDDATALEAAYMPWIQALHILLDYLIDMEEDRRGGDLNFVSYYSSPSEAERRLKVLYERAQRAAGELPRPHLHRFVVDGLFALYLSDRKARGPAVRGARDALLSAAGTRTRLLHGLVSGLRRVPLRAMPER